MKYYRDGRPFYESTGTIHKREAQRFLVIKPGVFGRAEAHVPPRESANASAGGHYAAYSTPPRTQHPAGLLYRGRIQTPLGRFAGSCEGAVDHWLLDRHAGRRNCDAEMGLDRSRTWPAAIRARHDEEQSRSTHSTGQRSYRDYMAMEATDASALSVLSLGLSFSRRETGTRAEDHLAEGL